MSLDPETQRHLFAQAVDMLGGQRPAARTIGCSERTIRSLISGERQLHSGFLRDAAAALIQHADACRKLERQISPAFAANMVEGQRDADGRYSRRQRSDERIFDVMQEVMGNARREGRTPRRWEINKATQQELQQDPRFIGFPDGEEDLHGRELLGTPVALIHDEKVTPTFALIVETANG